MQSDTKRSGRNFQVSGLTTIHKFENGTAGNLSLSTFILLLKVVGQINSLDDILPELPESPYLMREREKSATNQTL